MPKFDDITIVRAPEGGVKQSRRMSLVEAVANVLVGYGVAVLTQILVFPFFGLRTSLSQNLLMGLVFTVVSIGRSYALRRAFERIRMHYAQTTPPSSEHGHLGDSNDAALQQHRSERRSSGAVKTIIPVIQVDELAAAGSFG